MWITVEQKQTEKKENRKTQPCQPDYLPQTTHAAQGPQGMKQLKCCLDYRLFWEAARTALKTKGKYQFLTEQTEILVFQKAGQQES